MPAGCGVTCENVASMFVASCRYRYACIVFPLQDIQSISDDHLQELVPISLDNARKNAPVTNALLNRHDQASLDIIHQNQASSPLTAKFCSPLRALLDVCFADCRSRSLDCLDEIFQHQWRFQQLVRFHVRPRHFQRALVPRRARSQHFFAVDRDLKHHVSSNSYE